MALYDRESRRDDLVLRLIPVPLRCVRLAGINAQGYADETDETDRSDRSRPGRRLAQRADRNGGTRGTPPAYAAHLIVAPARGRIRSTDRSARPTDPL